MIQRLDAIAGIGWLIAGHTSGVLDWNDPDLLRSSDFLATAVWPALDEETRDLYAAALEGFAVAHALNTDRNGEILSQLENITVALNGAGITPLVLKGAGHLATGLWPTPGSRLIGDIDLLVEPEELGQAFTVLEELAGEGPQDPGDPVSAGLRKHLYPVFGAGGPAPVEIHHSIFAETSKEVAPAEEIRARSLPITLGSARLHIASPTDRVLHAILHGPSGSGTYFAPRLHMRDLLDIHFLDRKYGAQIDWVWLEDRLERKNWAPALEITNQCLERFVGMSAPFRRGNLLTRLDVARWQWQLAHPGKQRLGRAANLLSHTVWSLSSGGDARRYAFDYLRKPATYGRAFRRFVLGRRE